MFENRIGIRPHLKPGSGTAQNNQNWPEPDPQHCLEKRLNSTLDQYTKLLPMFFIIVSFAAVWIKVFHSKHFPIAG